MEINQELYAKVKDELLDICKEERRGVITIAAIQRYCLVGYIPAARVMDQLEEDGYVSSLNENMVRKVLK